MTKPTTDFSTRPEFEAKTHQLFSTYASARLASGERLDGATIAISGAFCAKHHAAMPVEQIVQIAEALGGYTPGSLPVEPIRKALGTLARAKVLRARTSRGVRLYEVNY